ncbi:MAG: PhzF family phenazine biosynthesis protein [Anaerolineae bacterium]|nr:PhzF family phenazine biosynthesis protein [Anaerolineae bacterium]
MPRLPFYQIDAFTDTPYQGNPAAVCLLANPLADSTCQAIAVEMALSETAFLLRTGNERWEASDRFSLRWFTPKTEVRLCGHATLASAAALFDMVGVRQSKIVFETLSGELIARKEADGIALDFPIDPPEACPTPEDVTAALGTRTEAVLHAAAGTKTRKLLLRFANANEVAALAPDFVALLHAPSMRAYRGLIVTAPGPAPYDFSSRYFAPWVGINEDPVTGSAHTVLAPYWAERLKKGRLGEAHLHAYQASARGGELRVRLMAGERVELVGQAVTVAEGFLTIPE